MRRIVSLHRVIIGGQRGSVINIALLILILLTLLGITFVESSSTDIKVVGNDRVAKMAFYAAEAGRSYVVATPVLYGGFNVTASHPKSFPLPGDASAVSGSLDSQSFSGMVQYLRKANAPRGTGTTSVSSGGGNNSGSLKAIYYKMNCVGEMAPRNASATVEAGFYRVGY